VTILSGCLEFFSSFFSTIFRFAVIAVMGIGLKQEFITLADLIFSIIYIATFAGAKGRLGEK
jgi:hypothetical protein